MKAVFRFCFAAVAAALLNGCSLLEVKLESGIEPLPQEQLNMRVFSRDFSTVFYSQVESAADLIERNTDSIPVKSNTLMWKINAEQNLQHTIFQASPTAAMLDTWVFTEQMVEFFETGAGKNVFGEQQAVAVEASIKLRDQFERTVKNFGAAKFSKNQEFVKQYVASHPIKDMAFARESAFTDWLDFHQISEFDAITTFGTVPEVMSDISDRMAMIAEQMPKILGWKAELYALHSNINADEIQRTLTSISDTSAKFQQLMAQSPEMMQALAVDMRKELTPLLAQLSADTDDKLAQLSLERQALELMVKNERQALETMVARERAAAAMDLEQISQNAVEVVFQEITKTLKSLILYFVLFLVVVFFAPLGLGVWLGKRMQIKKQTATELKTKA
ncbi:MULTISPECIES: chemotaxis protein [Shewanella]|uniref:Chemotaxis protein n=1 Tax=Shewanella fidelis TaxID=173509 RepID=A0AAW8NM57_9GAMM|nr:MULTISPECIES: chemotaxis protein [Shewanella]MDR8523286.1 chemotaxis protein [Shewanella fidelis]MDW4811388.1 chemotaxis protein [Shewanella fidelis]MDW4815509.1 chemotaxis protein [Shewanella fidelis]MDW4819599.1 chemotaxis protein [Shewanella fidelis]MDW4824427.1 chemotaxis protein [Shewanella fidelis]